MDKLYTVSFSKVLVETIGHDEAHNWKGFQFDNVEVNGEKMSVFFCKNEKGMFVIAGKLRKGAAHRSCGRWHSGNLYYDIYFRKNFRNSKEGNEFYKSVKNTMTINF